jgi:uncharacterized membrane protein
LRLKRLLSNDFFQLSLVVLLWAGLAAWSGTEGSRFLELLRILLGAGIVLFFPGYAIQSAVFPRARDHDAWTRVVFSLGFSLIIFPIVALGLNATPLGLNSSTVVGSTLAVYALAAVSATLVRRRIPEEERDSPAVRIPSAGIRLSSNRTDRILQAVLISAAVIGFLAAGYLYLVPSDQAFTEFYLSERTSVDQGSRVVTAGEPFSVRLGIYNHEGEPGEYRIVAVNDAGQAVGEAGPVLLGDGMRWEGELTMVIVSAGEHQKIEILLDRTGSAWPYRMLRLWITAVLPSAVPAGTH